MPLAEKPPILRGTVQEQLNAIRDYLFKMASSLDNALLSEGTGQAEVSIKTMPDGTKVAVHGPAEQKAIEDIRANARQLRDLIIKSANELQQDIVNGNDYVVQYVDSKTEEYNSMYLARSEFGTFEENINTRIEQTARGVVESYNYSSSINSMQDSIDLMQSYLTQIDGKIQRGIVLDPSTGDYVTGIAISQNLQFAGECGPSDSNNPGDGYTYYYLTEGQTFGLYTSTGWQFWVNGAKRGWFDSIDENLHVSNEIIESSLQISQNWSFTAVGGLGIKYVGG